MKGGPLLRLPGVVLAALLGCTDVTHADSTLTIFPAGGGTFLLRGDLLEKISSLDISVEYDAGTLGSPRVSCGSMAAKASCSADSGTSGVVRVHIGGTNPLFGWGQLATISFTPQGEEAGTIQSMDARATDANGDAVAVESKVVNPDPDQLLKRRLPRREQQPLPAQPASSGVSSGGSPASPVPAQIVVLDGCTKREEAVKDLPFRRVESVLDGFRTGRGLTHEQRLALFGRNVAEFTQEPAVVLSDGQSKVRLIVEVASGQKDPKFMLSGVSFLSLSQEGDRWSIEMMPAPGGYEATMTVITDKAAVEYPLTLAPPLAMLVDGTLPADPAHEGSSGSLAVTPAYLEEYIRYANLLAHCKKSK